MSETSNIEVAALLAQAAQLLDEQGAAPYRGRAYRRAAQVVLALGPQQPVTELVRSTDTQGLERLPGIGPSLVQAIRAIVLTGQLPMVQRLRGDSDPLVLLSSIPGIGKKTAGRLHHELGIDTLEELQAVAHDGWMAEILSIGEKRLEGIRESLNQRLGSPRRLFCSSAEAPIAELLEVDREYRDKAKAGVLYRIAPRRQNPQRQRFLPVLHTHRGDRHYTAMFANTPRAHRLRMTQDWVVLHSDGGLQEQQCTVITSRFGPLSGKRIVRGRESECASYYEQCSRQGLRKEARKDAE